MRFIGEGDGFGRLPMSIYSPASVSGWWYIKVYGNGWEYVTGPRTRAQIYGYIIRGR
jgi:hypothetical protein